MYCGQCGTKNEESARFCDSCGTDLRALPTARTASAPSPVLPGPLPPPVYFPPARPRPWWYPIGVWVILSAFFLFVDLTISRAVTWSYWPIGILGIFMVGFPLLHLLEARLASR